MLDSPDIMMTPPTQYLLYVGLYARGGQRKMPGLEDRYHWALQIAPKGDNDVASERMEVHHVKERLVPYGDPPVVVGEWQYIHSSHEHGLLLARILVGEIKNIARLQEILRNNPLRPDMAGWNCVYWVREALETAGRDVDALSRSVTVWQAVRDAGMRYVEHKKSMHRFDGEGQFDLSKIATWDLMAEKEISP